MSINYLTKACSGGRIGDETLINGGLYPASVEAIDDVAMYDLLSSWRRFIITTCEGGLPARALIQ